MNKSMEWFCLKDKSPDGDCISVLAWDSVDKCVVEATYQQGMLFEKFHNENLTHWMYYPEGPMEHNNE